MERRSIKFRGKSIKTGKWVYGSYLIGDEWSPSYIYENTRKRVEVVPETVGQFTSREDENGKELFEGDEVIEIFREYFENSDHIPEDCQGRCHREDVYTGVIVWWDCGWFLDTKKYGHIPLTNSADVLEIIGTIHENPELLK